MNQNTTMPHLAIDGGPKAFARSTGKVQPKVGVAEFLSIARRFGFNEDAIKRIARTVSDTDLPAGGPNLARYLPPNARPSIGEAYEAKARQLWGVKHALPTSSGTGSLHAAMVAIDIKPGDEVICPALGFIATAAAVRLAGGRPVFCDIDHSLQIDPAKIESCITQRTVAVIPTHHMGSVTEMTGVNKIAKKHHLKVVEDCAQSPGAHFDGRQVGTLGDIGCFSISAYKIIGGGESGMLITDDTRLYERASQFVEGGGLWRPNRFAPARYEGELFAGANYRLSELEAAVNLVQLDKLKPLVTRFQQVNQRILSQLSAYSEILPQRSNDPQGDIGYMIRFFPETHELSSKIAEALRAEGIIAYSRGQEARPDWHLYSQMFPIWHDMGEEIRHTCPLADDLYSRMVSMNISQWWSPQDCDAVAAGMNKVFDTYCQQTGDVGSWPATQDSRSTNPKTGKDGKAI